MKTLEEVRAYLDSHIQFWREQQLLGSPIAVYYIDALQMTLLNVFGQVLQEAR